MQMFGLFPAFLRYAAGIPIARKEQRTPMVGCVLYSCLSNGGSYIDHDGVTADVSSYGASIYTHQLINKGSSIKVIGKVIGDMPRPAEVRWCSKVSADIYKVGFRFIDQHLQPYISNPNSHR